MRIKIMTVILLIAITATLKANVKSVNDSIPAYSKGKYFLLNMQSTDYKVNIVELNSDSLYMIKRKVELYNVQFDGQSLILFSVLPSKSKMWIETTLDRLGEPINIDGLKSIMNQGFQVYKKSERQNSDQLKRTDINLVINKDGKYFVSSYCLTEFFLIIDQELIFPNEMGNIYINTKSPLFSINEFETKYKSIYKEYSPNAPILDGIGSALKQPLERPLNFLSGKVLIDGYTAYKFWTFFDWGVSDGLNSGRGIDRFLYVPEIGIIGGSFDFWFDQFPQFESLKLRNYLEERLMLPVSINHKKVK